MACVIAKFSTMRLRALLPCSVRTRPRVLRRHHEARITNNEFRISNIGSDHRRSAGHFLGYSYLMEIALLRLPVAHVPEVVYYYRSHGKSASLGGNIDGLAIGLDEKLTIAKEFMKKHCLQPAELHHLRRAMAVQLNSTIIEAVRTGHWRLASTLVGRVRRLGAAGPLVVFTETCRLAGRFVAKRAGWLTRIRGRA